MLENIEYLPVKNEFKIGDVKNLAVATTQKDDMSRMYPRVSNNTVSNADMLSQSFGTPTVEETPKSEPVQVSAIPNVQNSFNMEASPVDLNVNPVVVEPVSPVVNNTPSLEVPSMDTVTVTPLNETMNKVPTIEPINNTVASVEPVNNVTSVEPINNNGINSDFNVSGSANIFDAPVNTPFNISQEEINKPLDEVNSSINSVDLNDTNQVQENNIFSQPAIVSPVIEPVQNNVENQVVSNNTDVVASNSLNLDDVPTINEVNTNDSNENIQSSISDDILLAQIAIEESNVKHYEALAENSKKKIELLKRQMKNTKENVNLENTASDLFNNNGFLDEEKVLGKTPMPNMMVA